MLLTAQPNNDLQDLAQKVELDLHNKRIKLYEWANTTDLSKAKKDLYDWAQENDCDKIIIYANEQNEELEEGLHCQPEGMIDNFFKGRDAYIYSAFLSSNRNNPVDEEQENKVLQIVEQDQKRIEKEPLPTGYKMRKATESDVTAMAVLYNQVFETYPTPMNNPEYIKEIMNDQVYFTIVEHNGDIVSSCSADVFADYNVAEMTDCATLPEHRGQGILSQQFIHLEEQMEQQGIQTLFSYSRAVSVGMNLINARQGYTYRGTMVQNSNISGRFEDMNIWVKTLT